MQGRLVGDEHADSAGATERPNHADQPGEPEPEPEPERAWPGQWPAHVVLGSEAIASICS